MWQELALTGIGFVFGALLIPLLIDTYRGKKSNIATAFLTSGGIYFTGYIYLTLGLLIAVSACLFSGTVWLLIGLFSLVRK